jgi:hypothetical protein
MRFTKVQNLHTTLARLNCKLLSYQMHILFYNFIFPMVYDKQAPSFKLYASSEMIFVVDLTCFSCRSCVYKKLLCSYLEQ